MKTRRTESPARKLATAPAKRSPARRATVDTSDIPPLSEKFFEHAIRNPYPPLDAATLRTVRKRVPQGRMKVKERLF
jgi:hypothetical protein